ncbi:uncharacterized protein TrAtP1_012304 [Trichoderma atroviride]|uniref:uncharacterized protein n=1 Tax=Hypocrea atroviridis TaxID=63577 RepID=UPI00331B8B98|nr:hypothetical protein TrAtP1_012304 [Trichoderma atroviride]
MRQRPLPGTWCCGWANAWLEPGLGKRKATTPAEGEPPTRDFAVMSLVSLEEEVVLPLVSYRHQAVLLWYSCWSVSRTALFRVPDGMGSRAVSDAPQAVRCL